MATTSNKRTTGSTLSKSMKHIVRTAPQTEHARRIYLDAAKKDGRPVPSLRPPASR
jgi:hypothetical protein